MLDFLQKNKVNKEYFWSILIESQWITSAIWKTEEGKLSIVATSPSTAWDLSQTVDELVTSIDTSLSACTQNLPDEFPDPVKTVFGVTAEWVEDGNIKEEHLSKLKKVCEDLSLTPAGFVVLSEAIAHYIKSEEETSLSGIVIGISSDNIDVSIFNLGKLLGTTLVARSISFTEDVIEGLSRLSINDSLPPRIILYNQKESELEEIKSQLNDVNWDKSTGFKFMHSPRIEIMETAKKIVAVSLAGGSELGEITEVAQDVENVSNVENITAEDLGFAVDTGTHDINAFKEKEVNQPKLNFSMPNMPKINIKFPKLNNMKNSIIIAGSTILTFVVVVLILLWFLPKADVIVYVSPQKIEESINLNKTELSAKTTETLVSGEKTKSTTGTKLIGDKAKGTVKIQNGTEDILKLPAGTLLLSGTGLKFLTTKSASVSGAISTTEPGILDVDVEAGNIGSEFNLSKDEKFKVSNYPKADVEAVSVSNLTGGSSRQISAVSEEDRKSLLQSLIDELTNNAKTKIEEQLGSDDILVESSLVSTTANEDFSNKVNDEASTLKLNLSLKFTGLFVPKSELITISRKNLETKIPAGYVLNDDQLTYTFVQSKNDNFDLKINANLLPSIDPVDLAKKISGRKSTVVGEYLKIIPGYINADIKLGKMFTTLPHISKNIFITVSVEK